MKQAGRNVCLFIAASMDGFIARPDGDISFLNMVEQEGEDYGYSSFLKTIDTVILGRKTYDKILSMGVELPYGNRPVYVLTRSARADRGNIHFYQGDLKELIKKLQKESGANLYCDGGAETIARLMQQDLIDEMVISIIPVLLGEGIRLFSAPFPEKRLSLLKCQTFEKGLVQMHYTCRPLP